MANWWDAAPVVDQPSQPAQPQNWWEAAPVAEQVKPYRGMILPFSRDGQGNVAFDSNAGLLGVLKRAVTLPADVASGRVDPKSDEAISRSLDLAGIASPATPAANMGANIPGAIMRGTKRAKVEAPSAEALRAAAQKGYEDVRGMGVDYSSKAVADMAAQSRRGLEADGILAELAPKSFGVLSKLETPPAGSFVPFGGLEAARRAFGQAARDFNNPTDQLAAKRLVGGIDDFMSRNDPGSVVAGPAAAAAKTVGEARGNYAAAMRSDRITGAEDRAQLNAAVANSGQNVGNSLRQRARDILTRPKEAAGFDQQELAAIREVAEGTASQNTLRWLGNLLGGGGGLGAFMTGGTGAAVGSIIGGPLGTLAGLSIPVVGMAAKRGSNALTDRALLNVDEMTRMRSPLYQGLLSQAPMVETSPLVRSMAIRGLLATQAPSSQ